MLFNFFYDLLLCLLALIASPKILYQMIAQKKYRNNLSNRLGKGFPEIQKNGRQLVWIHAVSVGETKAIVPFAKLIKEQFNNPILLLSSASETGHAEAQRSLPFADYHVYLPLDASFIIKPIINRVKPDVVILTESDFWYNFLRFSKTNGAAVALVNGKISERSTHRLVKFPFFSHRLFSLFDVMCVQCNLYKQRFERLGAPSNKIVVTGNVKFDEDYPALSAQELSAWKEQLGISPGNAVLVVGSSHDPEEKLILGTLKELWKTHPNLKVIIVPRHPERFNWVADLIDSYQIPFVRYSRIQNKTGQEKVILLDAMGVLRKSYQVADIAVVGGSFTSKVGGHNILEPSWYGVPVIYGPYMYSQPDLVDLTKAYQTGLQVEESKLMETIDRFLKTPELRKEYKKSAKNLLYDCKGATQRTWKEVKLIINQSDLNEKK